MTFSFFPNLSLFFLNNSLITLLILFRWAAVFIPLPTFIPNFGPFSSVRLSRKIIKPSPLFLLPCKKVCRNSYSLLILTLLGYPSFFTWGDLFIEGLSVSRKPSAGLSFWPDAGSRSSFPPWWTCVSENHDPGPV